MDFISFIFPVLFCIVLLLRWGCEKKANALYLAVLIFASILFYLFNQPGKIVILFGLVLLNYLGGVIIFKLHHKNSPRRKQVLVLFITLNLSVLIYFKYTDFIIQNLNLLGLFSEQLPPLPSSPALPLGISFITFHAISYVLDVYHNRISAASLPTLFLYLSFFPKVASGPITKASDFFKQLNNRIPLNWQVINESAYLIISGAFLKLVCADRIVQIVNTSWSMGSNSGIWQ